MVWTIISAFAAAVTGGCPSPRFVPHDGALRFSTTDLAPACGPKLDRALTTGFPFRGQFGAGFGIEEELQVESLPGGALRVIVPGPRPASSAAVPFPSPDALARGISAVARTLAASGASVLAGEADAYARNLARSRAYRTAEWAATRRPWIRALRMEAAESPERLPEAARHRVVRLRSGYLRFANTDEVQEIDREGRLRRVVNAAGLVREIRRDEAGRIVGVADARGRGFSFQLDLEGRVVRATATDGAVVTYGYDDAGQISWTEDGEGRATLEWDDAGRIIRLTCGERVAAATYEAPRKGGRAISLEDGYRVWESLRARRSLLERWVSLSSSAPERLHWRWWGSRERYVYAASADRAYRTVTVYALPRAGELERAPGIPEELEVQARREEASAQEAPIELRRYAFVERRTRHGGRFTWQAVEAERDDLKVTAYDDQAFQVLSVASSDHVTRFEHDGLGRVIRREAEDGVTTVTYAPCGKVATVARRGEPSYEVWYDYDARCRVVSAQRGSDWARITYDGRGRIASIAATRGGTESSAAFTYGDDDTPICMATEPGAEDGEMQPIGMNGRRCTASAARDALEDMLAIGRWAESTDP